jgi:hypothetical protein
MSMLRSSKRTSEIANSFVDDGDDLHITESFQASEENSSVVGNASCIGSILTPLKSSDKEIDDGCTESAGSTLEISQTEEMNVQPIEERTNFKMLPRVSLKKGLYRAQKLLPWRFKTLLVRPRLSKAIQEYQEMEDPDGPLSDTASDVASYAGTFHSIRSSRVNIGNGRSLLVRQNAQVMGRSSVAKNEWDVGSKLSSSGSSGESSRRLGRSLSWDNSSCGARSDISQLTGDSFRSSRSNFTHSSRAMYIHPAPNLLGTTEEEEEQLENENIVGANSPFFDESPSTLPSFFSSRTESPRELNMFSVSSRKEILQRKARKVARKVANKVLLQRNEAYSELEMWDLFAANSNEQASPTFKDEQIRARVFSDSDFVFEMHRQRAAMDMCVDEDGFEVSSRSNHHRSPIRRDTDSASDSIRTRSYSDTFVPPTILTEQANGVDTAASRPRCASETFVDNGHWDVDNGHWDFDTRSNDFDNFEFDKDSCSEVDSDLFYKRIKSDSVNASKQPLVPPALTISRRHSQNDSDCIPLLSDHGSSERLRRLSDPGLSDQEVATSNPFRVGRIPSPSQWRARGAVVSCESETSGETNMAGIDLERQLEENSLRPTVLQPIQRLSSPTTASAAKMITSALRPPTATTPCPVQPSNYNYYWNDGSDEEAFCDDDDDDEEVLWSLNVDSFEEMF